MLNFVNIFVINKSHKHLLLLFYRNRSFVSSEHDEFLVEVAKKKTSGVLMKNVEENDKVLKGGNGWNF